jgi:secreted Zn-dependent insulinase-like peptidase
MLFYHWMFQGYIVYAHSRNQNGAMALLFVVQSQKHPRDLEYYVHQFLLEYRVSNIRNIMIWIKFE